MHPPWRREARYSGRVESAEGHDDRDGNRDRHHEEEQPFAPFDGRNRKCNRSHESTPPLFSREEHVARESGRASTARRMATVVWNLLVSRHANYLGKGAECGPRATRRRAERAAL